jgi:hypothetical protein
MEINIELERMGYVISTLAGLIQDLLADCDTHDVKEVNLAEERVFFISDYIKILGDQIIDSAQNDKE